MGILNLFLAASMPVLKVLLVTAVGSFLALDRIKILTEDALKHLNTQGCMSAPIVDKDLSGLILGRAIPCQNCEAMNLPRIRGRVRLARGKSFSQPQMV
ncbi:hypothetical protein DCAR_0933665 [Daucus carota subsp. sativus]|uniref:Uncharacterized protein n=1 Tax=Daucus carota subsp. sativus TaxID=79200 RepID=A0AAF1BC24_DAUCS|nr:hypothetical protein DCAR_0933665 [Daucus carota subsp. sativus]